MGKGLKGFRDFKDYLSYAKIYLFWMDGSEHKKTYDYLLNRQGDTDPINYILQMSLLAHGQD